MLHPRDMVVTFHLHQMAKETQTAFLSGPFLRITL
jgi:hypothetical protein